MANVSDKQKQLAAIALSEVLQKTTDANGDQLRRFREHIVRQLDGDTPSAFGCFRGPDKIVKTALDKSKISDGFTGGDMITIMFDSDESIQFFHDGKWESR